MADTLHRSSFLAGLVDPFAPNVERADAAYRPAIAKTAWLIPLGIGLAGLIAGLVFLGVDTHQFFFAYLVGWTFCLSLAIGAQFFVIIQHLTRAKWSVVVRRIAESLAYSFPLLALLALPWLLFGMHDLFHWTHHELYEVGTATYDPILAGKHGYLNVPFFYARMAIYFVIWTAIGYKLYALSLEQDVTGDPGIPAKQRAWSAVGLLLMAVSTSFASYDILMSLDPHWFSTIFGVYFFGASFWATMATIVLTAMLLQRGKKAGMLHDVVTVEHYQDLGKFMFGFTVFWAYIAFSQYMLIWYGNLPEETVWYRHRLEHGWEWHSAMLLILHFIVPFFVLVSRPVKRSRGLLGFMAVYFLIMHWFDFHWIAMPAMPGREGGFLVADFLLWIGMAGIFFAAFIWRLGRHPLVPQRDPYLAASLHFQNT